MSELDAEWEQRVAEAAARAGEAGRTDVAEYLSLRAANDLARAVGVAWLIDTFAALADEAMLGGADIRLAPDDEHSFRVAHATMVGRRLTLAAGLVRSLTVEAGWPRTPRDGVVRGRGIARARVSHFGAPSACEELLLVKSDEGAPRWVVLTDSGTRESFDEARARRHLDKLLG
ncbi:MAG: hypothetical protein ACJ741_07865 [Pyrinomonadaceae bacterium]